MRIRCATVCTLEGPTAADAERRARAYMTRLRNGTVGMNVVETADSVERGLHATGSSMVEEFIACKREHGLTPIGLL